MKKSAGNGFKPYSRRLIRRAAQKIARAVNPEKVILFGSYAYGRPTPDSDVDFFVVISGKTKQNRRNTAFNASKALDPRPFPVDILVRSSGQIWPRIRQGDFFLEEIMKKGQLIYEK